MGLQGFLKGFLKGILKGIYRDYSKSGYKYLIIKVISRHNYGYLTYNPTFGPQNRPF